MCKSEDYENQWQEKKKLFLPPVEVKPKSLRAEILPRWAQVKDSKFQVCVSLIKGGKKNKFSPFPHSTSSFYTAEFINIQ